MVKRLRLLFYCHDTFGLGHFRRTLSLAQHFTALLPAAEALIVTGSPLSSAFELPPRIDFLKLPAVTKQSDGSYAASSLSLPFAALRDLRATLLLEAARAYHPDVFLVDHAPLGLQSEAVPTLTFLQTMHPACLRVLGLRDILDASHRVQQNWTREGIYRTLEQAYHLLLVYGSQQFFDITREYALSPTTAQRVCFCGYLDRLTPTSLPSASLPAIDAGHEFSPAPGRLVVLTTGGGGDGFSLLHAYLVGVSKQAMPTWRSILLTGPLMNTRELTILRDLAAKLPAGLVRLETFSPDPLPLFAAADLVVSMAGYNTVCELLALRQRVLLVPRVTPRQEQLVRARLLARHGLVQMLHPEHLTPERLLERVQYGLEQPRPRPEQLTSAGISFHGQTRVVEAVLAGLQALEQHPSHLVQTPS